jgi:hypothetical protein
VINQFNCSGRIVRHASVSNEYLAISCEKYHLAKGGITEVYKLSEIIDSNIIKPTPIYTLTGKHRYATLANPNFLVTFQEKEVKTNL